MTKSVGGQDRREPIAQVTDTHLPRCAAALQLLVNVEVCEVIERNIKHGYSQRGARTRSHRVVTCSSLPLTTNSTAARVLAQLDEHPASTNQ